MSRLGSLRVLVKVRLRRGKALDETVKKMVTVHRQAIEAEDVARQADRKSVV